MNSRRTPIAAGVALLAISLIYLWVSLPFVQWGMPFFYNEDEGHHHNRVVNMVKEGQWNPKYFRKPSLHLYLRMPIVAAAFLGEVKAGRLKKLDEIQTYDKFALGKYAYTTSHPGIAKADRLFSVFLGLGTIVFTFLITLLLTRSSGASLGAALLLALSPAFVQHSSLVAVDIVMTFFALAAVYAAVCLTRLFTTQRLIVAGLLCGLTVSSKYNALPIMALPVIACFATRKLNPQIMLLALLCPVIGFFIASPFILVELPLFLNQFAYEIWHYAIAGHAENTAEPGIPQLIHYTTWLGTDGPGILALLGGAVGLILALKLRFSASLIVAIFPVLYSLLMISQRANFTRNMVVVIPFIAIFVAITLHTLLRRRKNPSELACFGALLLVCIQPAYSLLQLKHTFSMNQDSRIRASEWLAMKQAGPASEKSTAVAGQLLLPRYALMLSGVSNLDENAMDPDSLRQRGFDRAVVGAYSASKFKKTPGWEVAYSFPGEVEKQRVVEDPAIAVFESVDPVNAKALEAVALGNAYSLHIRVDERQILTCETRRGEAVTPEEKEGHCWLTGRFTRLTVPPIPPSDSSDTYRRLAFEAMTPWNDQVLTVEQGQATNAFPLSTAQEWKEVSIPLSESALLDGAEFALLTRLVESPKERGLSEDSRRLGIAVRNFRLLK
jgi:hypothetical protein